MEAPGAPQAVDRHAEAYARLRRPALRAARRWFPSLAQADLEDLYQAAWLSALRTQSEVERIDAYLYEAIRSEGLMELRRRRRRPVQPIDVAWLDAGKRSTGSAADRTQQGTDEVAESRVLRGLVEDVLAELSPRQRAVAKMRWGWGLSWQEIAALVGISERAVRRDLRRASTRLASEAEVVASGRWCERRRSLVTAYALGIAGAARAQKAELHLRGCAGCQALVAELRRRSEELAAVAPMPALAVDPGRGVLATASELVEGARGQLSDALYGAKHQAASLSARAADPTPLAGARPGAMAAVVASCVAVGGGTYCAVSGDVPAPIQGALGMGKAGEHRLAGDRRPPPTPAPQARLPEPATPPPAPERQSQAVTPTSPEPQPPPPSPAPEPRREFFGEPQQPATQATRSPSPPPKPAPAPAGGPGEFGGP